MMVIDELILDNDDVELSNAYLMKEYEYIDRIVF